MRLFGRLAVCVVAPAIATAQLTCTTTEIYALLEAASGLASWQCCRDINVSSLMDLSPEITLAFCESSLCNVYIESTLSDLPSCKYDQDEYQSLHDNLTSLKTMCKVKSTCETNNKAQDMLTHALNPHCIKALHDLSHQTSFCQLQSCVNGLKQNLKALSNCDMAQTEGTLIKAYQELVNAC